MNIATALKSLYEKLPLEYQILQPLYLHWSQKNGVTKVPHCAVFYNKQQDDAHNEPRFLNMGE